MIKNSTTKPIHADAGAEFAAALSLWRACETLAETTPIDLSECYHGIGQLMREVMRVAHLFEHWACAHVEFAELGEVWPYLLEDHFGMACLEVVSVEALHEFDQSDCLRTALRLKLPLKHHNASCTDTDDPTCSTFRPRPRARR